MSKLIACTPKRLPGELHYYAASKAIEANPLNRPSVERLASLGVKGGVMRDYLAIMTAKKWKTDGVKLTVSFLDNPEQALRTRIIGHMNAWAKTANVEFKETNSAGQVRIARVENDGYWSYLGTDILLIDNEKPTMNLESFTMQTPDSEFYRVVRHETGHTLGFPHEHMRAELIQKIDRKKAITYYEDSQGWSEAEVIAQVLTPIEESSILGTPHADGNSIMCYQIPGSLTLDGKGIPGGTDIDVSDYSFAASCYPKSKSAPTAPQSHHRPTPKKHK